jgi:formylglycine-generating enzyme required for sulfatase activity
MKRLIALSALFFMTSLLCGCIIFVTPHKATVTLTPGQIQSFKIAIFPFKADFIWSINGGEVSSGSSTFDFTAPKSQQLEYVLRVEATHLFGVDTHEWTVKLDIPRITSLSTQFGAIGQDLIINGYNFHDSESGNRVLFDDVQGQVLTWSSTSITVRVPSEVTNCKIKVAVGERQSNEAVFYTAGVNEAIKDITPDLDLLNEDYNNYVQDPDTGVRMSTKSLLVIFQETATVGDVKNLLDNINAQITGTFPDVNLFTIDLKSPSSLESITQIESQLETNPIVKYVSIDQLSGLNNYPSSGSFSIWKWDDNMKTTEGNNLEKGNYHYEGGNWGLKFARFPGAWNVYPYIKHDTKVKIGIIDGRVDPTHEDLDSVLFYAGSFPDAIWFGQARDHANHVAGIIGAEFDNGVGVDGANPFSEIYAADPTTLGAPTLDWYGPWSSVFDDCKRLVRDYHVKVINLSRGYTWEVGQGDSPNIDEDKQNIVAGQGLIAKDIATNFLLKNNVLFVAAAGNAGNVQNWTDPVDAKWASPFTWAAWKLAQEKKETLGRDLSRVETVSASNIIVVGAALEPSIGTGGKDNYYIVNKIWLDYVDYIFDKAPYSNAGSIVTISAPGTHILSTAQATHFTNKDRNVPIESLKYEVMYGTSMSAPMITGLIGYMYAFKQDLTPGQIIDYLISNNDDGNGPIRSYTDPLDGGKTPVINAFATMMRISGFRDKVLDIDGDGSLTKADWDAFKNAYDLYKQGNRDGDAHPYNRADINGDGKIDDDDKAIFPDTDKDGWPDLVDNCPATYNPGQEDSDGDGIGDACDLPDPISDLLNSLVSIPGGSFQMGSEDSTYATPVHPVTLQGFEIGAYEVTQAQYEAIMGTNPSYFQEANGYPDTERNPVEQVTWQEAREFCTQLSAQTGRNFTLPSEAQWEYACRAGTTTLYSFGDSDALLGNYAWIWANSDGTGGPYGTHPVGTKLPNTWNLYDMHGNVWEWCLDSWHGSYWGAPDNGSAWEPETGSYRVLRGGAWDNSAGYCRSAARFGYESPYPGNSNVGFRVVAVP